MVRDEDGGNRRWSLRAVAGLGAVWLLCSVAGAQLRSDTSFASTSAVGYVVHEVGTVEAAIHDEGVFANQIRQDRFRRDHLLACVAGHHHRAGSNQRGGGIL